MEGSGSDERCLTELTIRFAKPTRHRLIKSMPSASCFTADPCSPICHPIAAVPMLIHRWRLVAGNGQLRLGYTEGPLLCLETDEANNSVSVEVCGTDDAQDQGTYKLIHPFCRMGLRADGIELMHQPGLSSSCPSLFPGTSRPVAHLPFDRPLIGECDTPKGRLKRRQLGAHRGRIT